LECRPIQTQEAVSKAHEALQARRLAGDDPAQGGRAARLRGQRTSAALRTNAAWERDQDAPHDLSVFAEMIRPKLAQVTLAEMMDATGLSRPYCAMIRRGVREPHPRHWEMFRALVS